MVKPICPDSMSGLSRSMPTGHELGLEGREHGGDDGLPTGHDVSRPAALRVRLRSVVVVPAQLPIRPASGLVGVDDSAGLGMHATPNLSGLQGDGHYFSWH